MSFASVFVPGGADSPRQLGESGRDRYYLQEAYKHLKVIAALGDGRRPARERGGRDPQ